jgi:hypothetical protein
MDDRVMIQATLHQVKVGPRKGGWGVFTFDLGKESFQAKGHLQSPQVGVTYRLVGVWQEDPHYGRQLHLLRAEPLQGWEGQASRPLGDTANRSRAEEQASFMDLGGSVRIMVATKGFGMGIDKADVRLVVHRSPPGDLLSYAQEAGRAARDGQRSRAILYYTKCSYRPFDDWEEEQTDKGIQELFIKDRYVRDEDLQMCVSFLRHCRHRLTLGQGKDRRTYVIFSFDEVQAFLRSDPGSPTYSWPERAAKRWFDRPKPTSGREWGLIQILTRGADYQHRQKVVERTLEILFKTVVPATGGTLLESCQRVETCLWKPLRVDWKKLEDTNADHLRGILDRAHLSEEEFRALCDPRRTADLLPLAVRLDCSLEETVQFLRDASQLGVIKDLSLGTRSWVRHEPDDDEWLEYAGAWDYSRESGEKLPRHLWNRPRAWEVCLSPVLLMGGADLHDALQEVGVEHGERRCKDEQDFEHMLAEYVTGRQCLRKVLLAFLNTGEDIVDQGCGACTSCCGEGEFIPLEERDARILRFPNALWPRLEEVRRSVDALPEPQTFMKICAFLAEDAGERWREAVRLNVQAMLMTDRDSAGATALLLCLVARGWAEGGESEVERLLQNLWRRRATLGTRLNELAVMMADNSPNSAALTYWCARLTSEQDRGSSSLLWKRLFNITGVPRERLREAAATLTTDGEEGYSWWAARLSSTLDEAISAYQSAIGDTLPSSSRLCQELAHIVAAPGEAQERSETFVGLVAAAARRGVAKAMLMPVIKKAWPSVCTGLSDEALCVLLEEFAGDFLDDLEWVRALYPLLKGSCSPLLRGAILSFYGQCLAARQSLSGVTPEQVAEPLSRSDCSQMKSTEQYSLLEYVTCGLSPSAALAFAALAALASPEQRDRLARLNPDLWAVWLSAEGNHSLISLDLLDSLWRGALDDRAEARLRCLISLGTRQGRVVLKRILTDLDRTRDQLSEPLRRISDALLDLDQMHSTLRRTHLFRWQDIEQDTLQLVQRAQSCPVQGALCIAWLQYLGSHRLCINDLRDRLRKKLVQAYLAAGLDSEAESLTRSEDNRRNARSSLPPLGRPGKAIKWPQPVDKGLINDFEQALHGLDRIS